MSTSAFGGTAPLFITMLIAAPHNTLVPGFSMTAAGLVALAPVMRMVETAGRSLRGRRIPADARSATVLRRARHVARLSTTTTAT